MEQGLRFRLSGLTKFDKLELPSQDGVAFEESPVPDGAHGELATFSVVVTLASVTALAAFLLRRHRNESFEEIVEVIHPDGRVEKRVVRWDRSSIDPPEEAVLKQIRGPF